MKTRYLFGMPFLTTEINGEEVELLIDTGFNGSLLLPMAKIREWGLRKIAKARYVLADGATANTKVFSAEISWLSGKQEVMVLASPADFAVVGMELLNSVKTTLAPAENILKIE